MSHLPSRQSHTHKKKKQSFCLAILVSNTAIRKKQTIKKPQTPTELGIGLVISSVGNEVMGRSGLKSRMKLKSSAPQNTSAKLEGLIVNQLRQQVY